jgi:nitrate/TMAO reductase-like tetraheme cytochrome c subunit
MMLRDRLFLWFRPAFYLAQNPTTLVGAILTTSAALTLIAFWVFEIVLGGGASTYPYAGIIFFLILPGLFVFGLLLIPSGAYLRRRRLRRRGELPETYPQIDLRQPFLRRALTLVGLATFLNVAILSTASYRSVQYMDSVQFCGQTCHSVMAPEFTAYENSPHSRVACVDCHIGAGASWFVRSKLSGVRQVFAVTFHTYHRPIPSPVEQLRPARETCEQCHWPQRFTGDKFLVRTEYSEDEKNTPLTTVLVLKIGGHTWQGLEGIHGHHLDPARPIRYVSTDGHRQVIPQVTFIDDQGKRVVFHSTDAKVSTEELARGEHRVMDCMDCHNRPTHAFQTPERAADQAMFEGRISPELPYIKKVAVAALRADYPNRTAASQKIPAAIRDYYRSNYPQTYAQRRALVEQAGEQVEQIYLRNVFPEMNVTWGTYPNNIGHMDFPGCFRCHDGSHTSEDGRTIPNDCSTCHNVLAMQESNPKILSDLGMK